jgi:ubiquinone/menaquinone biosynthesis C-methylase UbiE/DNA-binding transcriptional ArsR family regulator
MDELLLGLKAAGEPTRLRILAVLARSELTVSELCRVLGQTQPRVSRHLRLLCEAGLLDRNPQGTSAFFRPARQGAGRGIFDAVLGLVDPGDAALLRDLGRLATIRTERAEAAADYFENVASGWNSLRDLHVADADVESAMLDAVDDLRVRDLLDVGTGTGRVLEIFADRIEHGLGVDLSRQMLDLARSRLDELGHRHCAVRHGNIYDLALDPGSMDVAVLHHVLHFLDDPPAAIAESARTLRPDGRLLIVDFAAHSLEKMRLDYAHRWLGFAEEEIVAWCQEAGLVGTSTTQLVHHSENNDDTLTVTLWSATQRADAPAVYNLEAAS